jgi:dTDP-4-dehydrorhamnose 3,5-epimerase-like enzyme
MIEEFVENLHTICTVYIFSEYFSMEETQTLCTKEIEIKTNIELSSCSSEKDEKTDTR